MKSKQSIISRIAAISGLFLGAFALAVAAGTWAPPEGMPPTNNVDAPINVGSSFQTKEGDLWLNGALVVLGGMQIGHVGSPGSFVYVDGNQHPGYVLSTDGNGRASWVSTTSLGLGGSTTINNFTHNREFRTVTNPGACNHWTQFGICDGYAAAYSTPWRLSDEGITIPTTVKIIAWGGGGGGPYGQGYGGGASSPSISTVTVDPSDTLQIMVGGGGSAGKNYVEFNCTTNANIDTGGTGKQSKVIFSSSDSRNIIAYGGNGGESSCGVNTPGGPAISQGGYSAGGGGGVGAGGQQGEIVLFW